MLEIFETLGVWIEENYNNTRFVFERGKLYITIECNAVVYNLQHNNGICVSKLDPPYTRINLNLYSPSFFNDLKYELDKILT